jgi:SAM-dependent methyltransferase
MANIDLALSGKEIYGDDFSPSQIEEWYEDEKEGYADLGAKDIANYAYGYHALNWYHGYRHIQHLRFKNLLGFGSAYGDELIPVLGSVASVTIVDPSDAFVRSEVYGTPARYVKPKPDGSLPFGSNLFDLVTCLGVLHHIPNVSRVMHELARTLEPAGYMLLREPIVSLGDWRHARHGLTKRERGIPLQLLLSVAEDSGLEIVRSSLCMFPATPRLFRSRTTASYNSKLAVYVDSFVSSAFAWNVNYHASNTIQRFKPACAFLVLRKRNGSPHQANN